MSASKPGKEETLWVLDELQIRHAISPRRHDIVDRLAASGPLSVRELSTLLGAQAPSLYHHIRQLVDAGMVVEAGHRIVRRRREQLYATAARRIRLGAALADPANDAVMLRIATGMTRQMDRDFRSGLEAPHRQAVGDGRNIGFLRVVSTPSPKTLRAVNRKLEEIAELLWQEQPAGHPAVAFQWLMAPLGAAQQDTETSEE